MFVIVLVLFGIILFAAIAKNKAIHYTFAEIDNKKDKKTINRQNLKLPTKEYFYEKEQHISFSRLSKSKNYELLPSKEDFYLEEANIRFP